MPWTLLTPIVAALIALVVYRYQNRLAYSVTTIDGQPAEDNASLKILTYSGRIQAERLQVKNYGWRTLEKVELHLRMHSEPVSLEVGEPSSLSKSAIEVTWQDRVLRIMIPTLPAGEEFKIDLIRVGHYEPIHERLKGTGGRYKIVHLELYKAIRDLVTNFTILVLVSLVIPAALNYFL